MLSSRTSYTEHLPNSCLILLQLSDRQLRFTEPLCAPQIELTRLAITNPQVRAQSPNLGCRIRSLTPCIDGHYAALRSQLVRREASVGPTAVRDYSSLR